MKSMKSVFVLIAAGIVGSACGNARSTPDLNFATRGTPGTQPQSASDTGSPTTCTQTNIQGNDQGFQFRACRTQAPSSIRIIPAGGTAQSVCVFAAQNGTPLVNRNTNSYVYSCVNVAGTGSVVEFPSGVQLNSLFISPVDDPNPNGPKHSTYLSNCFRAQYFESCIGLARVIYAFGAI